MQDQDYRKSILEMAHGAFMERADYEMSKILDNIMDVNTKATSKRKLTLTAEFAPDESRTSIGVSFAVKSTLTPTEPTTTRLYVAGEHSTGEVQVVEIPPQVPGQMSLTHEEQESPAILRLIPAV